MNDSTFTKSGTGASPYFGGKKVGCQNDSANVNTPHDGPAGGEVRRSEILDRAGSLVRPSLAGQR
jgi:hypothetical protein